MIWNLLILKAKFHISLDIKSVVKFLRHCPISIFPSMSVLWYTRGDDIYLSPVTAMIWGELNMYLVRIVAHVALIELLVYVCVRPTLSVNFDINFLNVFPRFINYNAKRCPYPLMPTWVFAINVYISTVVSSSIFKRFHWTKWRSRKFGHGIKCWLIVVSSEMFRQFITTFYYLFQTLLWIFLDLEWWPWHWLHVSTERRQKYNLMSNCTMFCNPQGVSGLICLES